MSRFTDAVASRPNDLPPAWDGLPVTWGEWATDRVFLCRISDDAESVAPHREPCPACGAVEALVCEGHATSRIRRGTSNVVAFGAGVLSLTAYRCRGCGLDHVHDGTRLWQLDPDDYTDEGSRA